MPSCHQPVTRAQRYAVTRKTNVLSIVKPTAMLETKGPLNCLSAESGTRSKRNFQRPESNCGVAINSDCEVFMLIISSIRRAAFQKGLKFFLHAILPRLVRVQDHARMKFWSWQKENLPSIAHSIRTAIAATAAVIAARLVQMPEAYWAAIATLVVMQSSLDATLTLSIE